MDLLNERMTRLTPAKRRLLESKLRQREGAASTAASIPRRGQHVPTPASFGQQWLWLVDRIEPGSCLFTTLRAYRLRGPLDVAALQESLRRIVVRHEVLRTTFAPADDGPPRQVVHPAEPVHLPVTDLSALPEPRRESQTRRIAAQAAREAFDLSQGPLYKVQLLRLSSDHHVLLLTVHHIVFDGWSTGVFLRELASGYAAACSGLDHGEKLSPPVELPIQYGDYAAWQREHFTEERLSPQIAYWKERLTNLPTLNLPTDRARPDVPLHHGARFVHQLRRELTEPLKELGRRRRATSFMVLLAGFYALLHRYSGDEDIVVGSQIAARNHVETEGLIGLFTNTLVLRTDVSGDPTFAELLERVRQVSLGAFAHQDLSYEEIVRRLNPSRELCRTPLFQVAFQLRNFPNLSARAAGVEMEAFEYDAAVAKLDLNLLMTERPHGFEAVFEYCTDLFDESTIRRMARHFETLLASAVADPDCRVSELPMLDDAERRQVLVEFNNTAADYPRDRCVHELIEAQVRRTPGVVAVRCEGNRLSYDEFNRQANRLARALRARGIGPDVPVGLLCERSLDWAVGVLGILKAGGAVLPLDSKCPGERLKTILTDAKTPLVLTQPQLADRLAQHDPACEVWAIRRNPFRLVGREPRSLAGCMVNLEDHASDDPPSTVSPHQLAYVIYTSGTTGTPKGVAITHRGLVNHNVAAIRLYGLRPDDCVLQFSATDFDIAVEEMLPAWMCGACVVFRTDRTPLDAEAFSRWCDQQRITVLDLPTAFWHAWTDELARGSSGLPESLRVLIVGGEAASSEVYKTWLGLGGGRVRWFNTYGPTETTVIATAYGPLHDLVPADVPAKLPIGRPIANVRVYILDPHRRPVPIGVPGELYIAGEGVARGYLNRPDLSAERFVVDPFVTATPNLAAHSCDAAALTPARMYRTSDRCRWLADGSIEFLGRLDGQVKIRGFRIEPGEVEAVLARHPSVGQCAVKPCGQGDDRRLVAYFTTDGPVVPAHGELRRYLAQRLPEYMVPAAFVILERMPLTHNGKLDRRALPEPELAAPLTDGESAAPRSETERRLAELWQDLLRVRAIGVRDDFFALGGHSLMAVRLAARMEQAFGVTVPLAALLSNPTIELLASYIDSRRVRDDSGLRSHTDVLVPLQPKGAAPPLFLVAGVGGHVFVFRELAELLGDDQPLYGLQGIGLDGRETPLSRMEAIAARYIAEITAIQPQGPYYIGGWSLGGVIAYEMAVQLAAQGRGVGALIAIDSLAPWQASRVARLRVHLEAFRRRSGRDKVTYIGQRIRHQWQMVRRRLGFYPEVVGFDSRTAELIRKSGLAQGEARRHYRPPPYDGDIVVIRAEHHPESRDPRIDDPLMGWDSLVRGRIHVRVVPGGHMEILHGESGRQLVQMIRPFLGSGCENRTDRSDSLLAPLRSSRARGAGVSPAAIRP